MRHDLVSLNLVLAVAQTRSITRGAEREGLALAAASKRLSDLETRLGVRLFERRARGVEPTEAGRALARHVRSLQASLHALEGEVAEFSRGLKGRLRIVANTSAIAEWLPADIAAFVRAHPGVRVSLDDLTSAEVQAAVADGRAEVGVFVPPQLESRLACRPYRRGELAVLAPRGHALASGQPVRFETLLDHDIVGLHLGAAAHEQMRERAQALGRTLDVRVQVRGFDAIAQLVEAGIGVALLPAAVAQRCERVYAVAAAALDEPWAGRDYLLAVQQQDVLPTIVQRFIAALPPAAGPAEPAPAPQSATRPRQAA